MLSVSYCSVISNKIYFINQVLRNFLTKFHKRSPFKFHRSLRLG